MALFSRRAIHADVIYALRESNQRLHGMTDPRIRGPVAPQFVPIWRRTPPTKLDSMAGPAACRRAAGTKFGIKVKLN